MHTITESGHRVIEGYRDWVLPSVGWKSESAVNFLAVADSYHDDEELMGFDLVDHSIIAHTDSIVGLVPV
jgi:hypothetical protein